MTLRQPALLLLALATLAYAAPPSPSIVDELHAAYAPYLDPHSPFAFPAKILSLRNGVYKFWRGSKDDFFAWSKSTRPDWFAPDAPLLLQHADLHLGNVGTYLTTLSPPTLAFGEIDFDDTVHAPPAIEPLECLITLRLLAADKSIALTPAQLAAADDAFVASYRLALTSNKLATDLIATDPWVADLLSRDTKSYKKMLAKISDGSHFLPIRAADDENAPPKELLLPAAEAHPPTPADIAPALAAMVASQPAMQTLLHPRSAADFQNAIKDVALRVRFGSSGSQGQHKYFLLLDRSVTTLNTDIVLYLKQEIPSAGQRADNLPASADNPAQRLVLDAAALANPAPAALGYLTINNETFVASLHNPWTDEGDPDIVSVPPDVVHAARLLGIAAGASHAAPDRPAFLHTLDDLPQLQSTAAQYVTRLTTRYHTFLQDPQSQSLAQQAQKAADQFIQQHKQTNTSK